MFFSSVKKKVNIFCFLALLFSCSASAGGKVSSQLEKEIVSRWSLVYNHDFGALYEYETPAYKDVFSKEMYVSKFGYGVGWNDMKVESITFDPDNHLVALVSISVDSFSSRSGGNKVKVKMKERWLFSDGKWWYGALVTG